MLTDRDKKKLHKRTQRAVDDMEFELLEAAARQIVEASEDDVFNIAKGVGPVSIDASKIVGKHSQRVLNAVRADVTEEFEQNAAREAEIAEKAGKRISEAVIKSTVLNGARVAVATISEDIMPLLSGAASGTIDAYVVACNKAAVQVSRIGTVPAMKNAVSLLGRQGVTSRAYTRKDGVTVKVPVDVGIRRAMVNAGQRGRMAQTLSIASSVGHDLVEVNSTSNARESHAEWQGQVYSLSGSSKDHKRFSDACNVGDPVDGIGGYNCGHEVAMYYAEYGKTFSDPLAGTGYTTEQVRELTDKQRALERGIRRDKREAQLLESVGLDASKAKASVNEGRAELRKLISENDKVLYRQPQREQTYGVPNA